MLTKETPIMTDAKEFVAAANEMPKSYLCKGPPRPLPCYCRQTSPERPKQEPVKIK